MTLIRIDGWRAGVRFDAAHFIPGHPKCGRLHGHTYALHVVVHGKPDPTTGFIADFGDVKSALKRIADDLDHHVLVAAKSAKVEPRAHGGSVVVEADGKHYVFPEADTKLLSLAHTSAEALAEYVADELLSRVRFPALVERVEVGVDESYGKGAWTSRSLRG